MSIEGSCHCGAVRVRVDEVPTQLTTCNCSICRRLGWQLAYDQEAQVRVEAAEGALQDDAWGDRLLAFKRCGEGGVGRVLGSEKHEQEALHASRILG